MLCLSMGAQAHPSTVASLSLWTGWRTYWAVGLAVGACPEVCAATGVGATEVLPSRSMSGSSGTSRRTDPPLPRPGARLPSTRISVAPALPTVRNRLGLAGTAQVSPACNVRFSRTWPELLSRTCIQSSALARRVMRLASGSAGAVEAGVGGDAGVAAGGVASAAGGVAAGCGGGSDIAAAALGGTLLAEEATASGAGAAGGAGGADATDAEAAGLGGTDGGTACSASGASRAGTGATTSAGSLPSPESRYQPT